MNNLTTEQIIELFKKWLTTRRVVLCSHKYTAIDSRTGNKWCYVCGRDVHVA